MSDVTYFERQPTPTAAGPVSFTYADRSGAAHTVPGEVKTVYKSWRTTPRQRAQSMRKRRRAMMRAEHHRSVHSIFIWSRAKVSFQAERAGPG